MVRNWHDGFDLNIKTVYPISYKSNNDKRSNQDYHAVARGLEHSLINVSRPARRGFLAHEAAHKHSFCQLDIVELKLQKQLDQPSEG
uniref:Uncharacterized protein n=1 Tax=Romanomermis culicivorax TaxID=13658 RepID=A0A915KFP0_ROMCU